MTTLEPGASDVFTQGLRSSPASTAFFASSAAPTITDGLDVLVHDVIAAMTTAPWSSSKDVPSSSCTGVCLTGRPLCLPRCDWGASSAVCALTDTGSLAGNDSAEPASNPPLGISSSA